MTENFNFNKYSVIINIAAGVYEENVNIYDYTTPSGVLSLMGVDTGTNGLTTIVKVKNGYALNVAQCTVYSTNIKYQKTVEANNMQFGQGVHIESNGILYLDRFELQVDFGENIPSNRFIIPIHVEGILSLRLMANSANGPSRIIINNYTSGIDHLFRVDGGRVTMLGAKTAWPNILCSGACSTFMALNGGVFSRNTGFNPVLGCSGSMSGKRYSITGGGKCGVSGLGPEYFPCSIAGTVDAETFSYYK